jgi:hypothetical protein
MFWGSSPGGRWNLEQSESTSEDIKTIGIIFILNGRLTADP